MKNIILNNQTNILTAEEVSVICKVKIGKAYQIIRTLNQELENKGYLTLRGRINKLYLFQRLGLKEEGIENACQ